MTTLSDVLKENHYNLSLREGNLEGNGAEFLKNEAASSNFFLLGEEHGIGSSTDFARALVKDIQPYGYAHYVNEIGPQSAKLINRFLSKTDFSAHIRSFYEQYPFSIPFSWYKEEVYLIQEMAAAGSPSPIIGVDQEFVFSPQLHLDTLLNLSKNTRTRAILTELIAVELLAHEDMKKGISPDKLKNFMSSPLPDSWQEVREMVRSENNLEAQELIEALEASHRIYMYYAEGRYHDNNHFRSQLMKQYFYAAYKKVRTNSPEARFLIKLGANHISRGHSAMGVLDIGNFISELAVVEDSHSFHLFVVPISGAQNIWLPFLPETYKAHPLDGDYGAGANHLLANAPYQDGLNLYDLRPLRNRQKAWSKDEPQFKNLFLNYDAVLLISDARPAALMTETTLDSRIGKDQ